MREGKTNVQFQHLYGYELGEDGKPRVVPEQAAVVEHIYDSFLAGRSIRMIKRELEGQGVLTAKGGTVWSEAAIRSILKNDCAIIGLNQQALMYQAVALIWFTYGSK